MSDDPVLARRAQLGRLASAAKSAGYLILLFGIGVFAAGAVTGFTPLIVRIVIGALVVASILLAPGIVLGYAVAAAEREDRQSRVRNDRQSEVREDARRPPGTEPEE